MMMPNGAHFGHLQSLIHSVTDIPVSVHACTLVGGVCLEACDYMWTRENWTTPHPRQLMLFLQRLYVILIQLS